MAKTSHQKRKNHSDSPLEETAQILLFRKKSFRHVLPTTCRNFAQRYLLLLATRSSSTEVEPIHDTWIADWTTLFARMQLYEARVSRLYLRFIYISHRISYKRPCNFGPKLPVKDFIRDHQLFSAFFLCFILF
jgi:hypothetical protein